MRLTMQEEREIQSQPKDVITGTVRPEVKETIVELAREQERSVAFIVGKVIEIGLPIYQERIKKTAAA